MPPNKEMRYLNECLCSIRGNNITEVKNIIETRFWRKSDRSSKFLFICDGNERYAREIEAIIMEASRLKDLTILRYLIKHGAQVNFIADALPPGLPMKITPLHVAVGNSLPDTVSLLLDNNADVNRQDDNERSALHLAVKRADCECTRMLLCHGAHLQLNRDGQTPLQTAAKFGHVELVRILLEHNPQIFYEGQKGPSPLHIAANEGHVPLIDIFSRYVDVNIRVPCTVGGHEKTALHLAAERGLLETVRFLLDRFGADVNVLDSEDQNALHCTVLHKHDHRRMRRKEDFDAMVDLFLKKHVKVNQANVNGDRPLHLASKNQYHRVVELLLLACADPLAKNNDDQIPLDVIADYDAPMRQLFAKYAVIASPYISSREAEMALDVARKTDATVEAGTERDQPLRRSLKNRPAPAPPGVEERRDSSRDRSDRGVHDSGERHRSKHSSLERRDKSGGRRNKSRDRFDKRTPNHSNGESWHEKSRELEVSKVKEKPTSKAKSQRTSREKLKSADKLLIRKSRDTSSDRNIVFQLHVEGLDENPTENEDISEPGPFRRILWTSSPTTRSPSPANPRRPIRS